MSTSMEPFDFSKIRLFVASDDILATGAKIATSSGQAHYLTNVMRKGVGDTVLLFNGRDGEWLARIVLAGKKGVTLEIEERSRRQVDTADLELLFAPIKKLRLDFLVQKAVELGVSALRPVTTEYTNAKVRQDRIMANAVEAAEQSGRLDVPHVLETIKLPALLDAWPPGRGLLYCDEARDAPPLAQVLRASDHQGPWSILIGPEGGFSKLERAMLGDFAPTRAASLGPRIMRADTAALAALAVFQATSGDW